LLRLKATQDFHSVSTGQHEVQKDQCRQLLLCGLDNELSVQEDAGRKSCTLHSVRDQRRYVAVIFNDKDQRG
jgi:hypothetical protein